MAVLEKILYTARVRTIGGRNGAARSDDGKLDVKLSRPTSGGSGTNPEQMFAAGYAACFIGAMGVAAAKMKLTVPPDVAIDAEVDLGPIHDAFGIAARLKVSLPGMEREEAQRLIEAAHLVCPYSNATRGNIDIEITLA